MERIIIIKGFVFLSAFLIGVSIVKYYMTLDIFYMVIFTVNTVLLYGWNNELKK